MDNKQIKSKAASLRKEYWGTFVLSDILTVVVSMIPLIGIVASPPVSLGAYENYYNAYKGGPTGWKRLYSKFEKQFESSFLYGVFSLITMIVFVIVLILVAVLLSLILPGVGLIVASLLFLAGIFVIVGMANIGFALLLKNPEMSGNVAFSLSVKYAKKNWTKYVTLTLSYIGGILLSLITLGIYAIKFEPEIRMAFVILTDEILNNSYGQAEIEEKSDVKEKGIIAGEKTQEGNASMDLQAEEIICPKCGTKNDDDAIFCERCGNRLS